MSNPSGIRFSQGNKDISPACNFSWEYPVPKCNFWDDFTYPTACTFLNLFGANKHVPVDLDSTLDKMEKAALLERFLQERLASKDATAAKYKTPGVRENVYFSIQYQLCR